MLKTQPWLLHKNDDWMLFSFEKLSKANSLLSRYLVGYRSNPVKPSHLLRSLIGFFLKHELFKLKNCHLKFLNPKNFVLMIKPFFFLNAPRRLQSTPSKLPFTKKNAANSKMYQSHSTHSTRFFSQKNIKPRSKILKNITCINPSSLSILYCIQRKN